MHIHLNICVYIGQGKCVMRRRMTAWVVVLAAGLLAGMTLMLGTAAQEQLGHVSFKVSCRAEAQQKFNRAMALYHSFAWKGAQPAFAEIARLDPKCGMAWWGQGAGSGRQPLRLAHQHEDG